MIVVMTLAGGLLGLMFVMAIRVRATSGPGSLAIGHFS